MENAPALTPDLFRWAEKMARRFGSRYGDADGRFEGCVGTGLDRAWRTHDPARGPFEPHAKHVVKQALCEAMRSTGPLGYRRDQLKPGNHLGAPTLCHLSSVERQQDFRPAADQLPVGWEVDYADFVESLARTLPGQHGDVIRGMYLEARAATVGGTARMLNVSSSRVSAIHAAAIGRIRSRLAS